MYDLSREICQKDTERFEKDAKLGIYLMDVAARNYKSGLLPLGGFQRRDERAALPFRHQIKVADR